MPKKLKSNNDLFASLQTEAAEDISERNETLERMIAETKKEKEYIDVSLLHPAPREWNVFPPLPEIKMLQMKLSIFENGIWVPVIVWEERDGSGYMILSGHNRVQAVREIISENQRDTWKHDYSKIPCIVYGKDEITEEKAQELILDTNYIQREMTPKTRVNVIARRTKYMHGQTNGRGETIDELIKTLGLKKTAVYEDISISCLIPELSELYFSEKISRKAVLKFTMYSTDMQQWIYDNFKDSLTTNKILLLDKNAKTKQQIKEIFSEAPEISESVRTTFMVPKNELRGVRKVCKAYLYDPDFARMCHDYFSKKDDRRSITPT